MLDVEGLTYRYGNGTTAVDGLSFRVPSGSVCGLVGRNGAGKTTSMRAILGLLRPSAGSVRWGGKPIGIPQRLGLSYFPAQRGLYARMRVAEQVVLMGRLHGMSAAAASAATDLWLARLGVDHYAKRQLNSLSEGEQQRVQLAACFLYEPTLAVLDEPFTLLDIDGVGLLIQVLREVAASGTAVLVSSHQLDVLEDVCDNVVIMDKGRLVAAGVVDELRSAAPRRVMRLRFATPGPVDWALEVAGVHQAEGGAGEVVLHLDPEVMAEDVVVAAAAAGTIVECSWSQPRLRDLYRVVLEER